MKCEKCNGNAKAINSRWSTCGYRRRRYKCDYCTHRFSTIEVPVKMLNGHNGRARAEFIKSGLNFDKKTVKEAICSIRAGLGFLEKVV